MIVYKADTPEEFRQELIKRLQWELDRNNREVGDTKRTRRDRDVSRGRAILAGELLEELRNAPILSNGEMQAPLTPEQVVSNILAQQKRQQMYLDGAIRDIALQTGVPADYFDRGKVAALVRELATGDVKLDSINDLLKEKEGEYND